MKKFLPFLIFVFFIPSFLTAQSYCENFDGFAVPTADKAHAFNIYGNGNAGFLSRWYVPSGTPSVYGNGDFTGVTAYTGTQYALAGVCDVNNAWADGLEFQNNFAQNQSYNISMAIRNTRLPFGGSTPTSIDIDFVLLPSLIPYSYNPNTGCSAMPAIPSGAITVFTLHNFATDAWRNITFSTGILSSNYSYLWIRPHFASGAPLTTTLLLLDSFCINQSISSPYCESFDGVTVPAANKQQAFNIYGNGNAGFLSNWFVASGTPSIQANGDFSGVNAYNGTQYALQAVCNTGALFSEGLMLQYNFFQNQNYSFSFAIRNMPLAPNVPTPIDVDYILLPSIVPYTYNPNTGCSATPAVPVGSLVVHTISSFNTNSWQTMSFNTGTLSANYSYLWIRPRFSCGCTAQTTFFLTDSFCTRQLLCSPAVNLGNDTAICPGQSVVLNAANPNATYLWGPNGETTPTITVTQPGTYSVTVTGECGPSDIATDQIVVAGDVTPPTALCKDITVVLSGGVAAVSANDIDDGSTDNCSLTLAASASFDCSNVGANSVTLTGTDGSGNSTSCTSTVTVVDNTSPTALCKDITVALSGNTASVSERDIDNGSFDDCSLTISASASFDCSNLGGNTVTLTATDGSGNSSSCTSTVTVVDNTSPTALCKDITVALSGSSASVTENDINNGSTDNCSLTLAASASFDCSNLGANSVTLTATDGSGNSSSCTSTVTVVDNTSPTALCKDITVALSGNTASITESDIDNGSSDNCSLTLAASASFDCSNLGANSVTLTATDGSGNSSSCTSTVTVVDNTSPTAHCKDITVALSGGSASVTANDIDNGSSDNCSLTLDASASFDCSNLGANSVTLTATDGSGNSSSCTSTITVTGNCSTPFSCAITSVLAASTQITNAGNTTIYLGYGPQSTTLLSSVSVPGNYTYSWSPSNGLSCMTCPSPVFTPTQQGNFTFTLTVMDPSGNSSTCSITICVLDIRATANCSGLNGNGGNSPGKVWVCHLPPGNPANVQTICIGIAGVPAHVPLHGGDHLGRCDQVCGSAKMDENIAELLTDINETGLDILFYPNPFVNDFHIIIESGGSEPVSVRLFNVTGQLLEDHQMVELNQVLTLAKNLDTGVYFAEVRQGSTKRVIRAIKTE